MTLAYSYIRFSTAEQAKGDSLRRQIELREKYLEGKNLVLDKTLTMNDLGGSAFNGANAETGAFGTFLEAVSNGKVPRGSFLLVESLDRLSRAPVDFALEMFLGIIRKGVTIVTLEDGKEYSQASLKANYTDLIVSITIMARAHGESLRKSDLISSAWKKKRLDAATTGKVMSKVVPFWLQAKDDRSGFVVVEGKVNLIRRMFELCLDGIGVHSIAKMMNEEGSLSPTGKAWRGANIAKFLRNRAVIGEATFTTFMNDLNKRMETDPIPNYFPAVISESDFYAVRDSLIDLLGDPAHSPKPYRVATDDEVRRRAKLSLMINSLVENIQMYSVGFDLKAVARQVELDESKYFGYDKEFRFMVIKFKSGAERSLTWNGLSYKVENGKFVGDAWFGQPWPDIATYPSPSGKA